MKVLTNTLDFLLQLTSTDLLCYGESFEPRHDGKIVFVRSNHGGVVSPPIQEFSSTADSETYDMEVGIPGAASVEGTFKIQNLQDLINDKYFFNSGGTRLAAAGGLFNTVITIPIRKLPWIQDEERLRWKSLTLRSCLRYRPTELLGVIVLYLTKPPKLVSELREYLDSVLHCASPLSDLFTERGRFLRRVSQGGNKYRRLRRALLATIRKDKSLPETKSAENDVTVRVTVNVGGGSEKEKDLKVVGVEEGETGAITIAGVGLSAPSASGYQSLETASGLTTPTVSGEKGLLVQKSASSAPTQLELLLQAQLDLTIAYLEKWLGGAVSLPSRVDLRLSLVAFVGCFVTIACWQVMTDGINQINDWRGVVDAMSLPGSFGALCTIVFALPAAPLAQPRIIFLAHTYAMSVSVVLTFIFPPYRYVWLQKALAVAFTVSGMAKLGIINPPAGAVSLAMLTYANSAAFSNPGLLFLIVSTYLGCSMCVLVGVVWHNCFTGRTYPLYW